MNNLLCYESNERLCLHHHAERFDSWHQKKRACLWEGSCFPFFAYKGTSTNPFSEATPLHPALREDNSPHKIGRFSCSRDAGKLTTWHSLMGPFGVRSMVTEERQKVDL